MILQQLLCNGMRTSHYRLCVWFFVISLLIPFPVRAQFEGLPPQEIPLSDLAAFRATGDNWQVAGGVTADRNQHHALDASPGEGVLVNRPTEEADAHLFTNWTHGDLEMELEVLLPRGSNSGIYLQGRYEIQLLDSWGVEPPTFSDMGGIYERWDPSRPEGEEGYQGQPPRTNAARAPGLWQRMRIRFRAPRFNEAGEKVANARFERVELNGVVIHEDVEVTGPTRGAAFEDEQPQGPLMIQGDHGPVALRTIRYKRYGEERLTLGDLQYRLYEGPFDEGLDWEALVLQEESATEQVTSTVTDASDGFALSFDGTIDVPVSGEYFFQLHLAWIVGDPHFSDREVGGGSLSIDEQTVIEHEGEGPIATGRVHLEAGQYPFELTYFKNRPGAPGMALWAEGPDIRRHALTAPESLLERAPPNPIRVEPQREPLVLRSHQYHHEEKRTHVASVGHPEGVHYSYDVNQGALLKVWKGSFVETTAMWHSRGFEQTTGPLGSVIQHSGAPSMAILSNSQASWPDTLADDANYRYLGHALDAAGRPTFHYEVHGVNVHDRITPDDGGRILTRELSVDADPIPSDLWLHIARAEEIAEHPDGSYLIDNGNYYIRFENTGGTEPVVRTADGYRELLIPLEADQTQPTVTYSMIW